MSSSFKKLRVRIFCLPDLEFPVGGVKQLYRHSEHLTSLGFDSAVLTQSSTFRPTWFTSTARTISLKESADSGELLSSDTIIMLPETYIGADFSSLYGYDVAKLPKVIFNQNAYYTSVSYTHLTLPTILRV